MTDLALISQDSLWPYNVYRAMTDTAYQNAQSVQRSVEMFGDKRFFDPDPGNSNHAFIVDKENGAYKVHWGIPGYENLVLPLYLEGVALAHVFGNFAALDNMDFDLAEQLQQQGIPIDAPPAKPWEYWRLHKSEAEAKFDDVSGKMFVYATLEVIRLQSAMKGLYDTGEISEDQYNMATASLNRQMDKMGLNGVERMMAVCPELEQIIRDDTDRNRNILITPDSIAGLRDSYGTGPRPDYATELLSNLGKFMPRGRYYSLMSDHVYTAPHQKQKLLLTMLGDDYINAFNGRVNSLKPYEAHGRTNTELNLPLTALQSIVFDPASSPQVCDAAAKVFFINYGLGSSHPKLDNLRARFATPSTQTNAPQAQIGSSPALLSPAPANMNPNAGVSNTNTTDASNPIAPNTNPNSQKKTSNPGGQGSANGPQNSPGNSQSGYTPSTTSHQTCGADDSKYNNFVTSGKIGSTVILGILGLFGAKKLNKKENEANSPGQQDKGKKYIYALEAAAAIGGIALVWWKGDAIFKGIGNFFNRGVA